MVLSFAELTKNYRIVDLSVLVIPGRADRRMEIRRGTILSDDTFMHEIDTMSHIGTHVEAPAHFYENGKDVTDLPLSAFIGDAILLDLEFDAPGGRIDEAYLEEKIGDKVKPGHILVLRNVGKTFEKDSEKPSLTPGAAHWLAQKRIKMLAFDTTTGLGRAKEEAREIHDLLMGRDITLLEVLDNLHELRQGEFLFMALPLKVEGLDSSPVRAVAFEPTEIGRRA